MSNAIVIPSDLDTGWINASTGSGNNVQYRVVNNTVFVKCDTNNASTSYAEIGEIPLQYAPNDTIYAVPFTDGSNYKIYAVLYTGKVWCKGNIASGAPYIFSYPIG